MQMILVHQNENCILTSFALIVKAFQDFWLPTYMYSFVFSFELVETSSSH